MTSPIDTIREALAYSLNPDRMKDALTALTEVEQQLVERPTLDEAVKNVNFWKDRAVAAETALAAANQRIELLEIMDMTATATQWEGAFRSANRACEAAERRANALADALREISVENTMAACRRRARAALDRQEQT